MIGSYPELQTYRCERCHNVETIEVKDRRFQVEEASMTMQTSDPKHSGFLYSVSGQVTASIIRNRRSGSAGLELRVLTRRYPLSAQSEHSALPSAVPSFTGGVRI